MINWNVVYTNVDERVIEGFANGTISGRKLSEEASFTEAASEVRKLLRKYGISKARNVARRAVSRRG